LRDHCHAHLDALICPGRTTQREHVRRGLRVPTTRLPYFLPEDYTGLPPVDPPAQPRPYVAAAGRLEMIKRFQDVIAAIRHLPALDLRIAGAGAFEADLRRRAEGLGNVHFEGRLDAAGPNEEEERRSAHPQRRAPRGRPRRRPRAGKSQGRGAG